MTDTKPLNIPMVHYRSGYKFQLAESFSVQTPITAPPHHIDSIGNQFVNLMPNGLLLIRAGYAWDGASGPIRQTPDIIRGSLVHDALYQLMRECGLSVNWRTIADQMLLEICKNDGMPEWLAEIVFLAVRKFGPWAIDPMNARPIMIAPAFVSYPSAAEQVAP